ncbi:hypothetical protein Kpho01_60840 [Kitasatospora phosalacinea]|uniref:Uncharacterized protein n=1 Tax=Kitasatospora phosalacinea TaxID=2065 RepID=A0A9W6PNG2_9ACTN|nr:hypothetical protein Kpho01_60840 [Kitasatospora phosalacinea]
MRDGGRGSSQPGRAHFGAAGAPSGIWAVAVACGALSMPGMVAAQVSGRPGIRPEPWWGASRTLVAGGWGASLDLGGAIPDLGGRGAGAECSADRRCVQHVKAALRAGVLHSAAGGRRRGAATAVAQRRGRCATLCAGLRNPALRMRGAGIAHAQSGVGGGATAERDGGRSGCGVRSAGRALRRAG